MEDRFQILRVAFSTIDNLIHDAENVLEKLIEVEKEVQTKSNSHYLMRITPYRTDEDRIKGVVVTFLDITERKKAEDLLNENMEELTTQQDDMISFKPMKKQVEALVQVIEEKRISIKINPCFACFRSFQSAKN